MNKSRNNNIEIMRIVLMFMIICHHCIINGYGFQRMMNTGEMVDPSYSCFLSVLNSIVIIGVNVFFLISGYYGINFKKEKLSKIVFDLYLYADILVLLSIIVGFETISKNSIKILVLPFYKYWFVLVYVLIYVLSPMINAGLNALSNKQAERLWLFFFVLFCGLGFASEASWLGLQNGYSLMYGLFLYCTGRVIYKCDYVSKIVNRISGTGVCIIWLIMTSLTAVATCLLITHECYTLAWHLFAYNQPMIMIASVSFMLVFLNCKTYRAKFNISSISKHILPVYYIHTSVIFATYRNIPLEYVSEHFDSYFMQFIFLIFYAVLILGICIMIDVCKEYIINMAIGYAKKS